MTLAYQTLREYKRLISKQIVTEDGIYKEDEVPSTYTGDVLIEVEVVHEVLMTDEVGRTMRLVFDIPKAKDSSGATEGGYTLNGSAYVTSDYPAEGGTDTELSLVTSTKLSEDIQEKVDEMIIIQGGYPPPSTA